MAQKSILKASIAIVKCKFLSLKLGNIIAFHILNRFMLSKWINYVKKGVLNLKPLSVELKLF